MLEALEINEPDRASASLTIAKNVRGRGDESCFHDESGAGVFAAVVASDAHVENALTQPLQLPRVERGGRLSGLRDDPVSPLNVDECECRNGQSEEKKQEEYGRGATGR